MYLIDTNVLSELPKKTPDAGVLTWLAGQPTLVVSAITIDELAFGVAAARAEQVPRLQRWFEALLALPPIVIPVDEQIARSAGYLRASRVRAGHNVSQADMLIAATAAATGRSLVTRNSRDFQGCGIPLLNPFSA